MKFLVDECVGHGVSIWLKEQGYDSVSISEVSPGISDDMVLNQALRENRILITQDKDFGDMVFRNKNEHCGIILLRLLNLKPNHKISILENVLITYIHELENNFIVVTEQAVRIIRMDKSH